MQDSEQHKIFQFIRYYLRRHGVAPTLTEIGAAVNIKSKHAVQAHLKALTEAGYIEIAPNRKRNIRLREDKLNFESRVLPFPKKIAAKLPIKIITQTAYSNLPDLLCGTKRYALQVKGNSMIEEGIFDGDFVICEPVKQAKNGEIIVALIDNREVTLKRFQKNKNKTITLKPANTAIKPMIYAEARVTIQAKFVGLLRMAR